MLGPLWAAFVDDSRHRVGPVAFTLARQNRPNSTSADVFSTQMDNPSRGPLRAQHRREQHKIARRLLQSTDLQIQQVAEQAGFASATVFGRCFKRAFAQTPRAYRQSLPTTRQ
ncbi:MAG: helix-turn-helix domain-containing protein [Pseudomonadales bacterium]|nr:MAG: helix-turn-helix domain-containing protein [Pseudomonadales bacterium]